MSRGVDLWAADIVIELRRYNKDLKLMCVIPFEGMEDRWPVDWKKHFNLVRKQADHVQVLSDRYSPDVYQNRNQWLVNHSSRLIAVFNGEPSGTGNTIQYAQEQGMGLVNEGTEDNIRDAIKDLGHCHQGADNAGVQTDGIGQVDHNEESQERIHHIACDVTGTVADLVISLQVSFVCHCNTPFSLGGFWLVGE